MVIKAIALSLALLFAIGIIVPLTTNNAEAGAHKHRKHKQRYKKYSKAWWRAYHNRAKRRQSAAARWRQMRLRQIRLAKQNGETAGNTASKSMAESSAATLPTGEAAPHNWKRSQNTPGELQFRVDDESGSQVGSAAISVVGAATGEDNDAGRIKTVGGISTTTLRRTVIDRMIRENGFVVNDFQKEVNGKKVYVVVAQSQDKAGKMQSRMFYFAESEGRIYSVATNAPSDSAERLASETEKVLNSLQSHSRTQQAAELH